MNEAKCLLSLFECCNCISYRYFTNYKNKYSGVQRPLQKRGDTEKPNE